MAITNEQEKKLRAETTEAKARAQRAQLERDIGIELASRGLTGERLRDAATVFMEKARPTFDADGDLVELMASGERFGTTRHALDRFIADTPWIAQGIAKPDASKPDASKPGDGERRALIDMPLDELATLAKADVGRAIADAPRAHRETAARILGSEGNR